MINLPVDVQSSNFKFNVDLDDVPYTFSFIWNNRDESWYFSLFLLDGTPVLQSKRVSLTSDLLAPRTANTPAGLLFAVDTSNQSKSPGFDELGDRVILTYVELADL